ncbi:TIM-barrel enzyme family protein [Tuber brumale]|nr:TIM-barrel enzyme family protein [Tuber brumale]
MKRPPATRAEALHRLRDTPASGGTITGAGAGIGLTAKFMEAGGADLRITYNSGQYRMAGRGSLAGLLPYGDANTIVYDMAKEVIPMVQHTSVLTGACGTDPFRSTPRFLTELRGLGSIGVQNLPTVGLIDGVFRQNLEETGMGFGLEVERIRAAHGMDMLTCPIGAGTALNLDECTIRVHAIRNAAVAVRMIGPIAKVDDADYVLDKTAGVHGFFRASSIERPPVEAVLEKTAKDFKGIIIKDSSDGGI